MKKQIKKINIFNLAVVSAIIAFALALCLTIFVSVANFVASQVFGGQVSVVELFASLLGGLVTAVLMAIVNFILGGFVAWLYNFITTYTKGVVVELEDEK